MLALKLYSQKLADYLETFGWIDRKFFIANDRQPLAGLNKSNRAIAKLFECTISKMSIPVLKFHRHPGVEWMPNSEQLSDCMRILKDASNEVLRFRLSARKKIDMAMVS